MSAADAGALDNSSPLKYGWIFYFTLAHELPARASATSGIEYFLRRNTAMARLLAALLLCLTGGAAHAELSIPVSEGVYNFFVIVGAIIFVIIFGGSLIAISRVAYQESEKRRLNPPPMTEVEKATAELAKAIKQAGLGTDADPKLARRGEDASKT
jgi:hypothetical protein